MTTVIMGHTHVAMKERNGVAYFNIGSWTRYYQFDDNEKTHSWTILTGKTYRHFPYKLHYAMVLPGQTQAEVKLWK